ncbi:MAG: tetratricopeptide repeat protein [Prevotella sp.]|nr:tetratricopeptide repeat protein [Prevotella sp.]
MQKKIILTVPVAAMLLASCSSKLGALSADNFSVTPNPLETQAGQVPVTVSGMFPEKYMKKKAVVTVTPELRFTADGKKMTARGQSTTFQGENVQGNGQTISYQLGGRYTMKSNFTYVPDMQQSDLYMTFVARVGKKAKWIPSVKVGKGVIATSELYKRTVESAQAAIAPDGFQRISEQKQEANVKFLIGQAQLRKSELQNNSVKEFVRLLSEIVKDQEGMALSGVEVSAYASPDGGYAVNERLAGKRQDVAADYVKQEMRKAKAEGFVDTKYTAEDWEGFQELVAASDIQDKDVILRVLSMYKDPEEREEQIRSLSSAFRELADGILPQLRRARMTINYQLVGRSDEQIKWQMKDDPKQLSVEEMLYAATLYDLPEQAEQTYKKTTEIYPSDARAYNNVAVMEYAKGNYSEAETWLRNALSVNKNLPEAYANLGLMALKEGDTGKAEEYISKATDANGLAEVLGNLHLAQGKYTQAEQDFDKVFSNSAALAQILNKNYSQAAVTLKYVDNPDATTDYLRALLGVRTANYNDASQALNAAVAKDPKLAAYAAKDLELAKIKK